MVEERRRHRLSGTRAITYMAFFTAMLVVLAQIAIPLPFTVVQLTLGILGVLLCGCFLGPWLGALSVVIYIVMGALGLPVFAGFRSVEAIAGPTGGYIIGYIPTAFIAGFAARSKNKPVIFGGLALAVLACYIPGITWTAIYLNANYFSTLLSGMVFLPFDMIKVAMAGALYIRLRKYVK